MNPYDQETHFVCDKHLREFGGKAPCCGCSRTSDTECGYDEEKKEITGWEKRESVDSFMEEYWKQEEKLIGVFDKSQGVALNRIALEKTIMEKVVMRVEAKEDGRKQYFAHLPELRVVDEVWVNGDKMATSQAIASAVEAREREISEAVKDFHSRQKEKSRNCPTCQSIRESGSTTATCANDEYHPWPDIRVEDVLSIINPSKE